MPSGGELTIAPRRVRLHESENGMSMSNIERDYIEITVSDNGMGIPADIFWARFSTLFLLQMRWARVRVSVSAPRLVSCNNPAVIFR